MTLLLFSLWMVFSRVRHSSAARIHTQDPDDRLIADTGVQKEFPECFEIAKSTYPGGCDPKQSAFACYALEKVYDVDVKWRCSDGFDKFAINDQDCRDSGFYAGACQFSVMQSPEASTSPRKAPEVATTPEQTTQAAKSSKKATEVATTREQLKEVTTAHEQSTKAAILPTKATEVATTPEQLTEAATTPKQSTEAATTPKKATEVATTPEQLKGVTTTSGQSAEAPTLPTKVTEVATTHEQLTEAATTPKQSKKAATMPEKVSEVATTPEQLTEAATTLEQSTEAATTPELPTVVATTPEQLTEAATTPEQLAAVATTPEQPTGDEESHEGEVFPECGEIAKSTYPGFCNPTVSAFACYSTQKVYRPKQMDADVEVEVPWGCSNGNDKTDISKEGCSLRPWVFEGEIKGKHVQFTAQAGIYAGACQFATAPEKLTEAATTPEQFTEASTTPTKVATTLEESTMPATTPTQPSFKPATTTNGAAGTSAGSLFTTVLGLAVYYLQ